LYTVPLSFRFGLCSLAVFPELPYTLEPQALLNAINHATKEEKEELIDIASEMVKLSQENIYSHTLDHGFHSKLYESGNNTAIYQIIINIREDRFVRQQDSKSGNDSIWLPTVSKHLELANAIYRKDIKAAFQAVDEINDYGFNLKSEQ
ncbi:hypothetical protein CG709_02175, partial [Lachnotalea glycerini]